MRKLVAMIGVFGVVAGAAALTENNSSQPPLASDVPNIPTQNVPVMIAQANQAQLGDMKTTRAVGVCSLIPNGAFATPPTENRVHPIVEAFSYLYSYESQLYNQTNPDRDTAIMTVLQSPKHGSLTEGGGGIYVYLPEKGYFGNDSATVLVSVGGIKVRVIYFFQSIDVASVGEGLEDALCENGYKWKISSNLFSDDGTNTITSVEYHSPITSATGTTVVDTATLASTFGSTLLSNLAGEIAGVTVNLADLPGAAIGQTNGTTITLDNNAAGYNWFIDSTPADNSEFLPTSNPNEWVAKAGSAAAGKM